MKILIAEDDPVARRLLQSHLERWGHEVVAARDGAEAWRLFEGDDFRLVISDWMMPELDGVDLIRRVRSCPQSGYVYAILVTARAEKEDLVQGMEAGADDFLTKPCDREELRVRLRAGERILQLEQTLAEQNRALRETQSALVQSEKLASLGQLAAGVAHEINNPIAYVSNNLAVLQRDALAVMRLLETYREGGESLAQAEPQLAAAAAQMEEEIDLVYIRENLARQFEKSREGLQRVRDIVRNLRDFARLDEAEFKEADLNAALESTVEILRYEVKKKAIRVETRYAALPPVLCHPGKINQVFLNLLMNAIQACEEAGVIEIRTRIETAPGSWLLAPGSDKISSRPQPGARSQEPGAASEASDVVIEIEDNGCGIRPEDRPHLFEPFFTTKPVGQGTGLGLSVSYGIIRDHGGEIQVESELGRGSVFRVRLPVRAARST
jgi:two-component system NtrC family sensor kinase